MSDDVRGPDAAAQLALSLAYRQAPPGALGGPLRRYGFSAYSQTDEDGILLFLFSRLGTTDVPTAVELCAGDGIECNAANLIINHGWHALLVDGDAELMARAGAFYAERHETRVYPPRCVQAWVTRDHVDQLLAEQGFTGEVDLLSLDLDGVDYWIWKALTVITPRVVVLEYQDILGPDRSWTVPYRDDFDGWRTSQSDGMPNFAGASLRAFAELGVAKGYRLVGVNRLGYNAFFVRDDLPAEGLPTVAVEDCFAHPKVRAGMRERFPQVADLPWVEL